MLNGSARSPLLLLLAAVLAVSVASCDLLGSSDGGGGKEGPTLTDFWSGTYIGTGIEVDYRGVYPSETQIEPTLRIAASADSIALVRLSWPVSGDTAVASIAGAAERLTEDSLLTHVATAPLGEESDSAETRFQFQLLRVRPDSSTIQGLEGRLRQVYTGDVVAEDSTIVTFTATRSE